MRNTEPGEVETVERHRDRQADDDRRRRDENYVTTLAVAQRRSRGGVVSIQGKAPDPSSGGGVEIIGPAAELELSIMEDVHE